MFDYARFLVLFGRLLPKKGGFWSHFGGLRPPWASLGPPWGPKGGAHEKKARKRVNSPPLPPLLGAQIGALAVTFFETGLLLVFVVDFVGTKKNTKMERKMTPSDLRKRRFRARGASKSRNSKD